MSDKTSGELSLSMENLIASIHTDGRWIGNMFDDYRLFPVLGDDPTTARILSGESLFKQLTKLMLKRANLAVLVNSLTGLSLLAQSKNGNLLEEAYRKIEENYELTKTINDRIAGAYRRVAAKGMAFAYVKESFSPKKNPVRKGYYLPSLFDKIDVIDRKFVSVSGVLNRIDRAQTVAGASIAKALGGSGISWVISDYPFFAMGRPEFHHGVVLLNMNQDVVARIEDALPFWVGAGWYPYVRVSGECRFPHSSKYIYPALTPSWIEYRTPKNPEDLREEIVSAYTKTPRYVRDGGFAVAKENPIEVLAYIDIVKIIAKGANLDVGDLRWLEDVRKAAMARAEATRADVFDLKE